jgi:uncharacterized protein (DUF433 family)
MRNMSDEQYTYNDRITVNPKVMVGKPVVKGTRIPVALVVAHLANNPDLADLFAAYPDLTIADVKACLAYATRAVERVSDAVAAPRPDDVARSREGIREAAGSWKDIDTEAFKAYIADRRHTANRPSIKL